MAWMRVLKMVDQMVFRMVDYWVVQTVDLKALKRGFQMAFQMACY